MTISEKTGKTILFAVMVPAALLAGLWSGCSSIEQDAREVVVGPPPLSTIDRVTDRVHGVEIVDPYRWLEDQESAETREWIEEQNAYTDSIVAQIAGRDALEDAVEKLVKIDNLSVPTERGGRYFYTRKAADQPLSVIYVRDALRGEERVLVDPHPMSKDHSVNVSIAGTSKNGRIFAYSIRQGGVDETEIRFIDVESGEELTDRLGAALYFGISLEPDGGAFYYNKFSSEGSRTYYHVMGTDATADRLVFGEGYPPEKIAVASVSEDGKWLIAHVMEGTSGPIGGPRVERRPGREDRGRLPRRCADRRPYP